MDGTWRCRSAVFVLVIGIGLAGVLVSPAHAASDAASRAQQLTDAIERDFEPISFEAHERRCLARELTARPALTRVSLAAGQFDALDASRQVDLFRVLAGCAPTSMARALGGLGDAFRGLHVPRNEARCLVDGMTSLDESIIVAGFAHKKLDRLSDDQQRQVLELDLRCLPTPIGQKMLASMMAGTGLDASDVSAAEARCVGERVAGPLAAAGPAALASEPPPALLSVAVRAGVDCAPDLMTRGLAKGFARSGVPKRIATCMATGIVADPTLLEALVHGGADASAPPSSIEDVAASCA